jgi:hypothetical protein
MHLTSFLEHLVNVCLLSRFFFFSAETQNANYVSALLPGPSNMLAFGKLQKCRIIVSSLSPRNFLCGDFLV